MKTFEQREDVDDDDAEWRDEVWQPIVVNRSRPLLGSDIV